MFINDLLDASANLENFGFADDFKLIVLNIEDLNKGVEQLKNWCGENLMETNTSKYKPLNFRVSLAATINKVELEATNVHKDIGLLIVPSLNWNNKCNRRVQEATRAFVQLKRNVSCDCS